MAIPSSPGRADPGTGSTADAGDDAPGAPAARPVGRPPRISRDAIAQATLDIGLADVSLRAVADRLGVSVAGLYHHIDGKDDLLRLAAEHTARQLTLPVDAGQSWAQWLLEWAVHTRDSFANQPMLLDQYIDGGISSAVIAEGVDRALGPLVRAGFTITEADAAYEFVNSFALGSAIRSLSLVQRRSAAPGASDYGDDLATRGDEALPHLRMLMVERGPNFADPEVEFSTSLRFCLLGIAAARGESAAVVDAAIASLAAR